MRAPDLAPGTPSSLSVALRSRTATRLALCLILGAIVNVIVAWGCARFSQELDSTFAVRVIDGWQVEVPKRWPPCDQANEVTWIGLRVRLCSGGALYVTTIPDAFDPAFGLQVFDAGWPLHALRAIRSNKLRNSLWARGVSAVESKRDPRALNPPIPLLPIPLGFAVNTLFYAAILFIPFTSLGVLKRRRRVRKDLCPRCAYDLAGLTLCPECGLTPSPPGRGQGEGS